MKKINGFWKFCVLIVTVLFVFSSCMKTEDPYAAYTPAREANLIKDWKNSVKLKNHLDSTASGIFYVLDTTKVGTGLNVRTGDSITVKYVGKFTDGRIFDSSANHWQSGKWTYVHKEIGLIKGWDEGIELLKKGNSATFLFPSKLAYGTYGSQDGSIPPNEPLIFILEVVDIK